MRFKENVNLAVTTGFLVGVFMGIVDIISKIIVWSFDWYEFYTTLIVSLFTSILVFFLWSVIVFLFQKFLKKQLSKEYFLNFYTSNAIIFLLLFYILVAIKELSIYDVFYSIIIAGVVYVFIVLFLMKSLLFGSNKKVYFFQPAKIFGKKSVKKFIENIAFFIVLFIIISFFMDLYLLYHVPKQESDENISDLPNIVLIVMDTMRADSLSAYGYKHNTSPNFDSLAKESVLFENAVAPTSWTLPSHASMFTGKYLYNHNTTSRREIVSMDERTLAEILRDKGYATSGFIGNRYMQSRYRISQGFDYYNERLDFLEFAHSFNTFSPYSIIGQIPFIKPIVFRTNQERTSAEINRDVFKWLDKNKDERFFLFLNYFDVHWPYTLGEEDSKKFSNKNFNWLEKWTLNLKAKENPRTHNSSVPDKTARNLKNLYDEEIFYLDNNIGKLLDKLDNLELKNNTLIVITSDHGEEFKEHGGFTHRHTLYEETIHVPLIFYYPSELSPKRIEERVTIIDVFSTILDITDSQSPKNADSVSLLPTIEGEEYDQEYVLSEIYGRLDYGEQVQQSISNETWKLYKITPEVEGLEPSLFNLKKDPEEKNNLYSYENNIKQDLFNEMETLASSE